MFEVPKKLLNKWNRKLKQEGLGVKLKSEETPLVPLSNKEALIMLAPDTKEPFLGEFLALENKLQRDIIADLDIKKEQGMGEEDITKRLHILVKHGHHLSMMSERDSDKQPNLVYSDEELKLAEELAREEADEEEPVTDEYVERLEESVKSAIPKKLH